MKADTYEHLLGACPWLAALEAKEGFSAKPSEASAGSSAQKEQAEEEEEADPEDLTCCEIMKSLDEVRAALAKESPV
eukprot:9564631-Lingulodinium_polyedra.AAC.1